MALVRRISRLLVGVGRVLLRESRPSPREPDAADHSRTFTNISSGAKTDAKSIENFGFDATGGVSITINATPETGYKLKATQSDLDTGKVYTSNSGTG